MSGMLLTEGVSWLHGPAPLTKLALVTKTASAGVTNWARYSDPEVDELHLKYRNSSDVAGRKAAYKTIQEKAAAAAATAKPLLPIAPTTLLHTHLPAPSTSPRPSPH